MSPSWSFTRTVDTSLVGVDVVSRKGIWASGCFPGPNESEGPGIVLRSVNGGKKWKVVTPPGGENSAFHDIEAFDRKHAVVLAVGDGEDSKIYRTADGGRTWDLVFQNQPGGPFYDGIAFFDDDHGLALSDPVNKKFRILSTGDGGRTWQIAPTTGMPDALPGESARATGTCLVAMGPRDAWFGTWPNGPGSRVFHTRDRGRTWKAEPTPIPGAPQFGIASLAFWDTLHGLALGGGDPFTNTPSVVAATTDGGDTWTQMGSPSGFRTNMAPILTTGRDTAVAVGFTGSDITTNGGLTWSQFDQTDLRGINAKPNATCWAVGKNLRAAELILP